MSYAELQSKDVVIRKPHHCEWCDERMESGEKAHYRSFIYEDGPQSGWTHPECWLVIIHSTDGPTDEWNPGDYARGETVMGEFLTIDGGSD